MSVSNEMRWQSAVKHAKAMTMQDRDWQEIQWDLINSNFFAPLFEGACEDEKEELTMAIIREGEELAFAEMGDPTEADYDEVY